ncbi:MAG: hypothetical protein JWR07_1962 [Nevskia sp.]|nr:hypothetical protein [Nevskia sp.]
MTTLWAIQHTTHSGSTWLDYTTVRSTRREAWRTLDDHYKDYADRWIKELARKRRKGILRAVKVTLRVYVDPIELEFPKGKP